MKKYSSDLDKLINLQINYMAVQALDYQFQKAILNYWVEKYGFNQNQRKVLLSFLQFHTNLFLLLMMKQKEVKFNINEQTKAHGERLSQIKTTTSNNIHSPISPTEPL
jgi:hypothetical protein